MTSTPDADARLLEAHDLALAALHEITPAATVGAPAGYTLEDDGVVSLRFGTTMEGYPGWYWTVSLAVVEDAEPTVLEVELLPGDGALLAPEWVPWAVRLADYQAAQAALAAEGGDDSADEDDDLDDAESAEEVSDEIDDLDDLDAADFDEDGSPILHAGDLDGVDIDVLDESADDDEDDSDLADDDFEDDDDLDQDADDDDPDQDADDDERVGADRDAED